MSNDDNRYCVKHFYGNVTSWYRGKELKDTIWMAAYVATPREFKNYMKKIEKLDIDTFKHLNYLDPRCWLRSHFNPKVKCDVLINNLNES